MKEIRLRTNHYGFIDFSISIDDLEIENMSDVIIYSDYEWIWRDKNGDMHVWYKEELLDFRVRDVQRIEEALYIIDYDMILTDCELITPKYTCKEITEVNNKFFMYRDRYGNLHTQDYKGNVTTIYNVKELSEQLRYYRDENGVIKISIILDGGGCRDVDLPTQYTRIEECGDLFVFTKLDGYKDLVMIKDGELEIIDAGNDAITEIKRLGESFMFVSEDSCNIMVDGQMIPCRSCAKRSYMDSSISNSILKIETSKERYVFFFNKLLVGKVDYVVGFDFKTNDDWFIADAGGTTHIAYKDQIIASCHKIIDFCKDVWTVIDHDGYVMKYKHGRECFPRKFEFGKVSTGGLIVLFDNATKTYHVFDMEEELTKGIEAYDIVTHAGRSFEWRDKKGKYHQYLGGKNEV